ncbi:MAG: hypothetical protein M3O61_14940 [Gemmatimonadota bacterium]|nr:hypothetical protein [Gemmatimonadota bacterium]
MFTPETATWRQNLDATFEHDDQLRLLSLSMAEEKYGIVVSSILSDFFALSRAFQSFYIETFDLIADLQPPAPLKWYWPLVFTHVSAFKLFRSAEHLFTKGYPFVGYSLLRELKDRAFILAAVARGSVSFRAALGWDVQPAVQGAVTMADQKKVVQARKKIDGRIRRETIGSTSGFDPAIQAKLENWNSLFHAEVHGSNLSFALDLKGWLASRGALPYATTTLHPTAAAMFVNRFEEAAWMMLRTLPFLQLSPSMFGDEWSKRWQVLNESLLESTKSRPQPASLFAELVIKLVDAKFSFVPDQLYYSELHDDADGKNAPAVPTA